MAEQVGLEENNLRCGSRRRRVGVLSFAVSDLIFVEVRID